MDPEFIKSITPNTADEVIYEKMLVLVREASRKNMAQAALKERILALGSIAKEIASNVPSLAKIFI